MMSFFHLLLAEAESGQSQNPLGMLMTVLPLFVIMYFLFIRPQQQQRKDLEKRLSALQKGDEVVTTAGIHAIVHNIKDRTVVLKVAEGVMMEFDKPSVASVIKKESSSAA
ncbi:preprotein translocase subunit YajC [Luteolibacter soli]|uniref:Sec translocon accessory complex subunit YajC n=1 Tax=Luteolibacter soli TaxID=3135280 RepID=A0ABU9AS87_9BACT